MIEAFVAYIQQLIATYGVWGVFAATIIEEVIAPIPSALVPLAAGFFLLPPDASLAAVTLRALLVIALPVSLGVTIGSMVLYVIAYFGGKPAVDRYGKILGVKWKDVEAIEARMTRGRRDEIALFTLRMVPIIPGVAVSVFCGAVRYPIKTFIVITAFGSALRALIIGLLGWQAGEFYIRYINAIDRYEKDILIFILVLILGAVFIHYLRKHGRTRKS